MRSALLGIGLIIVTVVVLALIFGDGDGVRVVVDADDEARLPACPRRRRSRGARPGRHAAAALPAIRSVAVLPLVNLSGNPEHEYFSDGLAEDIRNALIGVTDLRVAARTSSVAFRNKPMDVREIARQLNVEALLEGTVRMSDTRLRVTTQLTDGRTGYPIWASSFERPVTDKLALQTEVAEAILQQIAPSISRGGPLFAGATGNEQAHDAYLLGRYYWNQRTREGVERSINYFEQALARDPDYALAWSGLADAWSLLPDYADRSLAETGPKARQYAEKAVALDPDLAEARASLGMVLKNSGDLEGARVEYQKAVSWSPATPWRQMWLGVLMLGHGRRERGRAALRDRPAARPTAPGRPDQLPGGAHRARRTRPGPGGRPAAPHAGAQPEDPEDAVAGEPRAGAVRRRARPGRGPGGGEPTRRPSSATRSSRR